LADLLQQPQHASILAPQLSSTLLQLLSSRQTGRFQQLMALALRHFPISAASWPLFAKIADFKASQGYWASAAELLISIWPVADQTETLHKKLSLYCQKAGLPGDSLPAMSAAAAATRLEETKAGETHAPAELQDTLTFDANFMVDLTQEKDLERFEFIREIGQGGMGKVYLCRDRKLNRQVAFKTVHPYLNQDPNTLLFFKREAQFVAQLNHPNIVTLYDVGFRRGCYFLVMEYVHGTHLGQLHRTHPEYIRKHFLALWYETCLGLQAAHDHEVLHRDIKPANIMVSKDRRLKVMDFGLAKKENDPSLSDRRWVTPAFSAPEVIQGNRATYTSDIFSLGATFYFLASGEKPLFEGNEHMKLRSIRVVAPRINDSLADCIDKCLHLDPDHRYQSVKELLLALKLLSSMKIEPFQSSPAKND
jgi:predicted Ser/Thr protein kinase